MKFVLPIFVLMFAVSCKSRLNNDSQAKEDFSRWENPTDRYKEVWLKATDGTEIKVLANNSADMHYRNLISQIAVNLKPTAFEETDKIIAALSRHCEKYGQPKDSTTREVKLLADASRGIFGNNVLGFNGGEGKMNGWDCLFELEISINGKKLVDPIGNKETFVPGFLAGKDIPTPEMVGTTAYIYPNFESKDFTPITVCSNDACSLHLIEGDDSSKKSYQSQLHDSSQYSFATSRASGERSSTHKWEMGNFAELSGGGGPGAYAMTLLLNQPVQLLSGKNLDKGTRIETTDKRSYQTIKW